MKLSEQLLHIADYLVGDCGWAIHNQADPIRGVAKEVAQLEVLLKDREGDLKFEHEKRINLEAENRALGQLVEYLNSKSPEDERLQALGGE